MDRRHFLHGLALTGTAVTAGCSGFGGIGAQTGGSIPEYGKWMPATHHEGDPVWNFAHVDWDTHRALFAERQFTIAEMEDLRSQIPILGFSLAPGFFMPNTMEISSYPFSGDIFPEYYSGTDVEGINTRGTSFAPDPLMVFHGEYDPEVFAEQYAEGYDQTDTDGPHIYTRTDAYDDIPTAFAVSEDAVVVSPPLTDKANPRANEDVTRAVDVYEGEKTRMSNDDGGHWLLETIGATPFISGVWSETPDERLYPEEDLTDIPAYESIMFTDIIGFNFGLTASFTDEMTTLESGESRFAGVYYDADSAPSEDEVGSALINTEELDYEVTIDGNRVSATADVTDTLAPLLNLE